MAETGRRRDRQHAFNLANNITPQSIKSHIKDILDSVYEKDSLTIDPRDPMAWKRGAGLKDRKGVREDSAPFIGHNLKTHIAELEKAMKDAAADLEFETAARLRDEIKRLQETELFIADDPLARQETLRENVEQAVATARSGPSAGVTGAPGKARNAYRGRRRKGP